MATREGEVGGPDQWPRGRRPGFSQPSRKGAAQMKWTKKVGCSPGERQSWAASAMPAPPRLGRTTLHPAASLAWRRPWRACESMPYVWCLPLAAAANVSSLAALWEHRPSVAWLVKSCGAGETWNKSHRWRESTERKGYPSCLALKNSGTAVIDEKSGHNS